MKKNRYSIYNTFLLLCLYWVIFAFSFDVFIIVLDFIDDGKSHEFSKQITWKIDRSFQK